MLDFLPQNLINALKKIDINYLSEIRLRANNPTICNYQFNKRYLGKNGLESNIKNALIVKENDIRAIIENLTENSLYAYNDYLKNGFLTSKKGVRVGVCGRCVFNDDKIVTIKDISSLCIRIPHDVIGCSDFIFNKIRCFK